MPAKKRYRGFNTCASVLSIIQLFVHTYQRFAFINRPSRFISLITNDNRDNICLIEEKDLIDESEKYIRLGSSDFLRIYKELRITPSILDRFKGQDFYFSNEIFKQLRTSRQQKSWRYYICLEQNDHGHWMVYMREKQYIKRPKGHKIICLRK